MKARRNRALTNPLPPAFAELSHHKKYDDKTALLKDSTYNLELPLNVYDTKHESTILRRVYYFFADYRYTPGHPWYQSNFFHDELDHLFATRVNALYQFQVRVIKHMNMIRTNTRTRTPQTLRRSCPRHRTPTSSPTAPKRERPPTSSSTALNPP